MIDHVLARRQLATTIDFSLLGDAAIKLDHHVMGCADCTAFETALRRDAAVLRDLDLGQVGMELREDLSMEAGRRIGGGTIRWVTLAAATILLLTAVGAGAVGVGGFPTGVPAASVPPDGPAAAFGPIAWDNGIVQVQADDAWLEADGVRTALPAGPEGVLGGDTDKGASIIVRWVQGEADRTLVLAFRGDGPDWSLEQVELWRSNAGRFRQLVGSPAVVGGTAGDPGVDAVIALRTLNGDVEGAQIAFRGLRATVADPDAVKPRFPAQPVPVPPFPGKAADPEELPVDPLGRFGILTCSGILQVGDLLEAESIAAKLGFAIAWRVRSTGDDGVVSERDDVQPSEGVIIGASMLTPTAVQLVVAPSEDHLAVPIPAPQDCPIPGAPVAEPPKGP